MVSNPQSDTVRDGLTSDFEDELKKINQEIYERNVELAIRNRTFSILQKIYEIINTSLGVEETAQRVVEAMVEELKFQMGSIMLLDRERNELQTVSIAFAKDPAQTTIDFFKNFHAPLTQIDNLSTKTAREFKMHMTNDLYDVLNPSISEKQAESIVKETSIQTCMLYPIIFAGRVVGILIFGLEKHIGFLSRAEREILKELIGVVAIALERAQIYADLRNANEQLKEVDKLKDEFVSVASHELRTPMTAIKSYLWMALAGKGGPMLEKQKYYLDRAYKSTDRLIKLVNDMLNISRIESGRMSFEMQCIEAHQLINEVVAEVAPRAEELGIQLLVPQKTEDFHLYADGDKIKEVFMNLIGNSLKFTPRGGSVTILFTKEKDILKTDVKDNGVGIDKEDMGMLFKKFGLVKGSYTTNQTAALGTGLGLYICKSIVEAHKGQIFCTSEGKGKGTTFTFTLPICTSEQFGVTPATNSNMEKIGIIHSGL